MYALLGTIFLMIIPSLLYHSKRRRISCQSLAVFALGVLNAANVSAEELSNFPTKVPSAAPSEKPSVTPSATHSDNPSQSPSNSPSSTLSVVPSSTPTESFYTIEKCQDFGGEIQSVDDTGQYGMLLDAIEFDSTDFPTAHEAILDVDVSIEWSKTAGSCIDPKVGDPYNGETSFAIMFEGSTTPLVSSNAWSGKEEGGRIETIFDQDAISPRSFGGTPVSGVYHPHTGNLGIFNEKAANGRWNLKAGDMHVGDPLCVYKYCVSLKTQCVKNCPTSSPSSSPTNLASMVPSATPSVSTMPTESILVQTEKCQDFGGAIQTVDGSGMYGTTLDSIEFTPADFPFSSDEVILDANVKIEWTKTAGTCSSQTSGNPYHGETSFAISYSGASIISLVAEDTWDGGTDVGLVKNVFDQDASRQISLGESPESGVYRPSSGDLSSLNGLSVIGTWNLKAGDSFQSDPLCIYSYCVEVTTKCTANCPSSSPSLAPSDILSMSPSKYPTTSPAPSEASNSPSGFPSRFPTITPSATPTISSFPSAIPSDVPSSSPSLTPSLYPTLKPSYVPTVAHSIHPSDAPSTSGSPSTSPSQTPSKVDLSSSAPSLAPSRPPSLPPSNRPSTRPSVVQSSSPSQVPLTFRKTQTASAYVTFGGISKELNKRQAKMTATLFCRELRWMENQPEGVDAITCQLDNLVVTANGNLRGRIDATFYYRCQDADNCPLHEYGGPDTMIVDFFDRERNVNLLKRELDDRAYFSTLEYIKLRGTDAPVDKPLCAKKRQQSTCLQEDNCEWKENIKFCFPG